MRGIVMSGVLTLAVLVVTVSTAGADARLYKHPRLDFQFTAAQGWVQQARPEDELIYEVADPQTGIHVVLWYTSTQQSGLRYLQKMAGMKDLSLNREPERRRIDDLDAWVLSAPGRIRREPIHTLLAVIPCGKSRVHPAENALYIVQTWCLQRDWEDLSGVMADILSSVKIMTRVGYGGEELPLYPETLDSRPDLPSPLTTGDGRELVVAHTKGGRFTILPVTVENGAPLDYNRDQWNKGRQLAVDVSDFPTLAEIGLHSEADLEQTTTITGLPIAEITANGRPGRFSIAGFMADDEDIVSVLKGDNRLVARLGLTHPQLAKPLFNVFNAVLRNLETYGRGQSPWNDIEYLLWDGRRIFIDGYGSKGWQESIFADEVLGYFELRMWRELELGEEQHLRRTYSDLGEPQISELKNMLSSIHTGEMVPFYIMRYGFYEGHTMWRADPVAIAVIFGLRSVEEIADTFGDELYSVLTRYYSEKAPSD